MHKRQLIELMEQLKSSQQCVLAQDTAGLDAVRAFEQKHGFKLPEDMKEFYTQFKSAALFGQQFLFIPLIGIESATESIYGEIDNAVELALPQSWFAFADAMGNGDKIVIDLEQPEPGINPILDLFHEDPTHSGVIALSFTEFLADAMSLGKEESLYWINGKKEVWGEAQFEGAELSSEEMIKAIETEIQRMEPEVGPEVCRAYDCEKFHMPLSVMCRIHHLQVVDGRFRKGLPSEEYEAKPAKAIYERFKPWIA